jgi:DNA-binding phage protein
MEPVDIERLATVARETASRIVLADGIRDERDELIRRARAGGMSLGEIARVTGLSRTMIHKITDTKARS